MHDTRTRQERFANIRQNRRYTYPHAVRTKDLFPPWENYDYLVSILPGKLSQNYKANTKSELAGKIFLTFCNQLIDHLIASGDEYVLPISVATAILRVEQLPANSLMHKRRVGRYRHVDVIETDGEAAHLVLRLNGRDHYAHRPVRIALSKYDALIKQLNAGQRYVAGNKIPRRYETTVHA